MREDFSVWWAVGSTVTLPLVRMLFSVHVQNIEHVPASGPAIVAFNHVSVLDGPVLGIQIASRRRRKVRFLEAAEVFDHRVYGPLLRSFDQIAIRRGDGDSEALEEAVDTVRAGALAAVAPEGHVNPDPEAGMQRIRSGCARIAIGTGAPVIPVGIWGTQRRWPAAGPNRSRLWHRERVAIVYGPVLRPYPDDDLESFSERLSVALEEQVRRARPIA